MEMLAKIQRHNPKHFLLILYSKKGEGKINTESSVDFFPPRQEAKNFQVCTSPLLLLSSFLPTEDQRSEQL